MKRTAWNNMFRMQRLLDNFHLKRRINAKIVDSSTVNEHMVRLAEFIFLDMLMSRTPTAKDLKSISRRVSSDGDSHMPRAEKSVRRIVDYYPNITNLRPLFYLILRNKDGSYSRYPNLPNRENPKKSDRRLKDFMTPYSFPQAGIARLDTKCYVDANYLVRLERFWKDMLNLVTQVLENYGPIRKEMDWLVYHIVNNDIGLHILFDNLSTECEARWLLRKLPPDARMRLLQPFPYIYDPYVPTKLDMARGVSKLKGFIREFEEVRIPPALQPYKVQPRIMRHRVYELSLYAADAYHAREDYEMYDCIMEEIDNQLP